MNARTWIATAALAATIGMPAPGVAQAEHAHGTGLEVPASIEAEHREIQAALEAATREPGRVGAAARALAKVLDPHFVREEQIALPPLGLLGPLAAGERPAGMATALAMSDSLRHELPRMLEEHGQIRRAVAALRAAAREAHAVEAERLAEELALHAQTEEQVLYPAAVLAGDVIRARQAGR
ncbi:MAG TPA: hemerythrin domain-containing protein [Gemmatimonadales bacterium]